MVSSASIWPQSLRRRPGITMGGLHKRSPWGPEQIHPNRLLAELAEEFDRGIDI